MLYLYKFDNQYINWDYSLKKVYVVGILNFELDNNPKHDKIITHAKIRYDEYDYELYSNKLEFINVELPKFLKKEEDLADDNLLEKWLFAMKNLYHLMERPKALREEIFKRLFNLAEISKYDKNERLAYQDSLKNYRDYYNTMDYAKQQALDEGLAKGRAEGISQSKLEMAKKMKDDGMSIEIIQKYTELSKEQIDNL